MPKKIFRCGHCGWVRKLRVGKPGRPRALTKRDVDVMRARVIEGMTQGQIASECGLSRATINKYLRGI